MPVDARSGKKQPLSQHDIEEEASAILKRHGLYSIPVDPVSLANRNGIRVHNATFSEEGLSGMVAKRGSSVTILVNQCDPPFRKRFTIAHELGHNFLHLHEDGEFVDTQVDLFRDATAGQKEWQSKMEEVQANQFAAALLMPSELLKSVYNDVRETEALARIFKVSQEAMAIRLGRLGLA